MGLNNSRSERVMYIEYMFMLFEKCRESNAFLPTVAVDHFVLTLDKTCTAKACSLAINTLLTYAAGNIVLQPRPAFPTEIFHRNWNRISSRKRVEHSNIPCLRLTCPGFTNTKHYRPHPPGPLEMYQVLVFFPIEFHISLPSKYNKVKKHI